MTRTISATEARVHLGEVLDCVNDLGERIIVERDGKPAGAIVPMADYDKLEKSSFNAEELIARVDALRERIAKRRNGAPLPDVAEEIHKMREERDAQLLETLLRHQHPRHMDHATGAEPHSKDGE